MQVVILSCRCRRLFSLLVFVGFDANVSRIVRCLNDMLRVAVNLLVIFRFKWGWVLRLQAMDVWDWVMTQLGATTTTCLRWWRYKEASRTFHRIAAEKSFAEAALSRKLRKAYMYTSVGLAFGGKSFRPEIPSSKLLFEVWRALLYTVHRILCNIRYVCVCFVSKYMPLAWFEMNQSAMISLLYIFMRIVLH